MDIGSHKFEFQHNYRQERQFNQTHSTRITFPLLVHPPLLPPYPCLPFHHPGQACKQFDTINWKQRKMETIEQINLPARKCLHIFNLCNLIKVDFVSCAQTIWIAYSVAIIQNADAREKWIRGRRMTKKQNKENTTTPTTKKLNSRTLFISESFI